MSVGRRQFCFGSTHLAPDQHRSENHLEAVEEVVSDDDDRGAARRPPFARTDGLYTGCSDW